MSTKTKPLYGSFDFGEEFTIDVLVKRLGQISESFLNQRIFNSYLKTARGESYYGLDNEELVTMFQRHGQALGTISTSSSTEQGKGVNINIRFQKGKETGDGQFVIVAGNESENEEIRDIILGTWVPRPEPPESPEPTEEESPVSEPEEAPEELKEQLGELLEGIAQAAENDGIPPPIIKKIAATPLPQPNLELLEEKFHFNAAIPIDKLVDLIYDLFIQYLDQATFDIRLLTYGGDYHLNLRVDKLRQTLQRLAGDVHKLFVVLNTQQGSGVELILSYNPLATEPESELRIKTEHNKEIKKLILDELSVSGKKPVSIQSVLTGVFGFEPRDFYVEDVVFVVENIIKDFLKNANVAAFLVSKEGIPHHNLDLEGLKKAFYQYSQGISLLSIYLNRAVTGQNLNLVFEFDHGRGNVSILVGDPSVQESLKDFIWRSLNLLPFQPQTFEKTAPRISNPAGLAGEMAVHPAFAPWNGEIIESRCFVLLPPKSEIADEVWYELQKALEPLGMEAYRGDSIFGYMVIENLWNQINSAGLVIADVSERSPEVFYLLGIAHTLGKKVLILSRNPGDIPFDLKKYRHIFYEVSEEGFRNMKEEVLAHLNEH